MNEKPPRLILIADRDRDSAVQLGDVLKKRGYGVIYTYDGSNSIEVVITHLPDLIFYDAALPLIHYKKFIQIVRSNPRTMHIPIIIIGRVTDRIGFSTLTESKINKPYNVDVVVNMVDNIFHKIDTADMLKSSNKAFEGKLSEISLPDLLQVFAINKKTGLLKIRNSVIDGSIYLRNGEIVHAHLGKIFGEKVVYRLLGVSDGDFVFQPDVMSEQISIRATLDSILMEGMRQLDETRKIIKENFSEDLLYVTDRQRLKELSGLHPIAEDVISELKHPRRLQELLDRLNITDLEILTTLNLLINSAVVKKIQPGDSDLMGTGGSSEDMDIMNDDEWRAFSTYINENLFRRYSIDSGIIGFVCPNKALIKKFLRTLKSIKDIEFLDYNQVTQSGYGRLGHITRNGSSVEIYLLPINKHLSPFRRLIEVKIIGVIQITSSAAQSIAVNTVIDSSRDSSYINYIPVLNIVVPSDDLAGIKDLSFIDASLEIGEKKEPFTRYDISRPEEIRLLIRRFIGNIVKNSITGH